MVVQDAVVSHLRDLFSYVRDKRRGTFAQHGEDVWIDNYFAGKHRGFYVDIGASHPTRLSNTWKLYSERHWSGVTVEPIPRQAEAHRKWRPRDTLVEKCVGTVPAKRTFYELSPSVLSTLDEAVALAAVKAGTATIWRQYEIDVITLGQLFDQYVARQRIDLLSLDMEGIDTEVVASFSFDRFRPTLICAEANDPRARDRILAHFQRCGYQLAASLGCNVIVNAHD
jgi:hypothetical protein